MTFPRYGQPFWELYQLIGMFGEEWQDEYAHEYDVAEDWVSGAAGPARARLLEQIDAYLGGEEVPLRNRHVFPGEQLHAFLADVREGIATGSPISPPPGWPVREGERRPEGGFAELRHLAGWVARCLREEDHDRPLWFDLDAGELTPASAAGLRLRELAPLYLRRIVAECEAARALTDPWDRLGAIGGDEHWDPEQDPDAWLDAIEPLARFLLDGTPLPKDDAQDVTLPGT